MTAKYSVAIRTLATNHQLLRHELECVFAQSSPPTDVFIYIAQGYNAPPFRVAGEQYITVPKGMVSQRALPYDEVKTPYLLMLDDDVSLAPDACKKMLEIIDNNNLDCVVADVFMNHKMSVPDKIKAFVTAGTRPLYGQQKAIKVFCSGAFGYINSPKRDWYPTESGGGPAAMWRTQAWKQIDAQGEKWLDSLGFAYGDDQIIFNKAHKRGFRMAMAFNTGFTHCDGQSSSSIYRTDRHRHIKRIAGIYLVWYRSCCQGTHGITRIQAKVAFGARCSLMFCSYLALSVATLSHRPVCNFFKGLQRGRYIALHSLRNLKPYAGK